MPKFLCYYAPMKLIVGLGNPGEKYKNTRHNMGFMKVDDMMADLQDRSQWSFEKKFNAEMVKVKDTIFAKPQTFMNNSGDSVSKLVNFYNINLQDLLVVHDDVDLELGKVKEQFGVGSAGHKGVQSIIDALGSQDFWRMRVGIGRPADNKMDLEDWVLGDFGSSVQ
jgi:peptidyl-tRNA hydrolase, PTH1 family